MDGQGHLIQIFDNDDQAAKHQQGTTFCNLAVIIKNLMAGHPFDFTSFSAWPFLILVCYFFVHYTHPRCFGYTSVYNTWIFSYFSRCWNTLVLYWYFPEYCIETKFQVSPTPTIRLCFIDDLNALNCGIKFVRFCKFISVRQ